MTIDEAIRLQTYVLEGKIFCLHTDEREALKLGIEALKRLQTLRGIGAMSSAILLPGETKE